MISAQKEHLQSFFQGSMKYIIPFFQRPYVWTEENWETMWENVIETFDDYRTGKSSEHFIGTLIIKQRPAEKINESNYDLIDGQQRVTTISIFLKALANNCKGDEEFKKLQSKINELLVFEDSRGNEHIRIEHNRVDRKYFETIIYSDASTVFENPKDNLTKAFQYFNTKLKEFSDEDINDLKDILLHRVPVISMLLDKEDDEQEIFDTINSLGVKLTTAELLKNFVFKEKELQGEYEDKWFNVFEVDEETQALWNRDKTSGRVYRTNVEMLLYCFLLIETQKEVRLDKLFKEYKKWLAGKSIEEKKEFLVNLKAYAEIYAQFPSGEELNEIAFKEDKKRFFHLIEGLSISTIYPIILFLYKKVNDSNELGKCLSLIESYLVRRNICKYTTKNYNNLFLSMLQKLNDKEDSISYFEALKNMIYEFNDITNLFPSDSDLTKAFHNSILSNQNAREILYIISLFQKSNGLSDVNKLSSNSFSVEHIMPKKWEANWWADDFNEDDIAHRRVKLLTLGNLTLITKRLNSKLKNASWENKRDTLRMYSSLPITVEYLGVEDWKESTIESRAKDLSKLALEIWKKEGEKVAIQQNVPEIEGQHT